MEEEKFGMKQQENKGEPDKQDENQLELDKLLDKAKEKGEKIFEIPINISYIIKMPEGLMRSVGNHNDPNYNNLLYYQNRNVGNTINKQIVEGVRKINPELVDAADQQQVMINELIEMITPRNEKGEFGIIGKGRTSSFNIEKARELYGKIKEINEKFKVYASYQFLIARFRDLGVELE